MRNKNGALTNQWFGKFSHTEHESVVFHIQVDRTLNNHTHFPGILMIENKHHHQILTQISFPQKEELSMCCSCFHRLHAREHNACYRNQWKKHHICFLFVTAFKDWENLSQNSAREPSLQHCSPLANSKAARPHHSRNQDSEPWCLSAKWVDTEQRNTELCIFHCAQSNPVYTVVY